jgi:predicted ATPase/DNA-binding SARP family transcriptional activator
MGTGAGAPMGKGAGAPVAAPPPGGERLSGDGARGRDAEVGLDAAAGPVAAAALAAAASGGLAWAVDPYVRLLGRPSIEAAGGVVEPAMGKAWGLLVVLATRATWVERAELVYLFWPDQDESAARTNLRKLLSRNVAALPFAGGVEAEPSRLRWPVRSDVADFRRSLAEGRLAQALDLYRGPFLDGLRADALPEFEEWAGQERESLARAWRDAGTTLASQAAGEGRVQDAARVLRSLVDADPLDEEALQAYLQALAAGGRAAAGLDAYRLFAERLERELGESPSRATQALAESLRAAVTLPPAAESAPSAASRAAARALPRAATPFVGRSAERRRLAEQLRDPDCRLLTVAAPGGFGKTRLALAVAADLAEAFDDGVAFVPLAPVLHPDGVPFALAEALGIVITGTRPPLEQVAEALAPRRSLLVLDNLEHLGGAYEWLADLLDAAPQVRVLVTSREPLDIGAEWRFELRGLSLTPVGPEPALSDAARLFLQAAARQDARAAAQAPLGSVERLCRALGAMPLALELAAGWIGALDVDELVDEVERDLSLLTTTRRDVPDRHRSVVAVLEASLARLEPDTRSAFEGLGVFPSGFDRAAARAVAGITPLALRDLVARNLLATSGDGRFRLHELLRHRAVARLAEDPERERRVRAAHAHHYASWLASAEPALHGGSPAPILAQLDLDYDNVEAAFRWALASRDLGTVTDMAFALETYFVQRTRYAAGAAFYEGAAEALGEADPTVRHTTGGLLVWAGWLEFRRGRYDRAAELVTHAAGLLDPTGDARARIEAVSLQGALAGTRGDYDTAWERADRALALARQAGLSAQVATALNNLAITEKQLGLFRQAEANYREALALNRARGAALPCARNLNNLGLLLVADDRADEATPVLEEALALAREIHAQQVVPNVLGGLAKAALARGDASAARSAADEAWRLTRASGARGSSGPLLVTLALAAAAEGDHEGADRALAAAVEDARETHVRVALLATVAAAGRVWSLRGDHRAAVTALALVRDDPDLEHSVRDELGPAWRASAAAIGPEQVALAQRDAQRAGLEGLLSRLPRARPSAPREADAADPRAARSAAAGFEADATPTTATHPAATHPAHRPRSLPATEVAAPDEPAVGGV